MSVTSGFYDAKNGDRRYSAKQMSSIFDGIIRDGVFMNYGSAFSVKAGSGMEVTVGIGRAWFNHTWTLNDAILPLPVSPSEVILNRIDAVVLEVDTRESVRANSIKIVKGVSATNPSRPTLIKSGDRWQYPLAYITINSGITSIRQSMITNMVGTESCPFVTAPLESMNIDNIVSQWRDQWVSFYDEQVRLILGQKTTYLEDVDSFNRQIKDNLNAKKAEFENEIREYLTYLHGVLDGDTAANIAGRLLKLESKEVEVIDNLTTDDPSKPVSARQGMLLSKEINKKGISIIDAYETNNVFDCSGDSSKKIVPGVPFFMNIKSVTHSVLNINHQTRARIRTESGVEEVDIRGLNSSPINVINSSIRILLCVFDTYLKVDTTNTSLDYKIQQAFQLAHEGKQMLSDALVSKGLVVDSGASFQEMADKIREIQVGKYDVGSVIPSSSFEYTGVYREKTERLQLNQPYDTRLVSFRWENDVLFVVFEKHYEIGMTNYKRYTVKGVGLNRSSGQPTELNLNFRDVNVTGVSNSYFDLNNLEIKDGIMYALFGSSETKRFVVASLRTGSILAEADGKGDFRMSGIFPDDRCAYAYDGKSRTIRKYHFVPNQGINETSFIVPDQILSSGSSIMTITPYNLYIIHKLRENTEIRCYSMSNLNADPVVHPLNGNKNISFNNGSAWEGTINTFFNKIFFQATEAKNHRYGDVYELDYKTNTLRSIKSIDNSRSSNEGLRDARFFPLIMSYGGLYLYIPNNSDSNEKGRIRDLEYEGLGHDASRHIYSRYFVTSSPEVMIRLKNDGGTSIDSINYLYITSSGASSIKITK